MAGFIPAIHALMIAGKKDVDGRDKPGHDKNQLTSQRLARLEKFE